MKFEEGVVLEDEKWQAPVYYFQKGSDRKAGRQPSSEFGGQSSKSLLM